MVFACLQSSLYNMTADVWRETIGQTSTGQITREWHFVKTIPVEARSLGNLRGKQSGTEENWRNVFISYNYLRVKTNEPLSNGDRLTNLKDSNGVNLWREYDQEGNSTGNTIFGVIGVSPMVDPFGGFLTWDVFANRAGVQNNE